MRMRMDVIFHNVEIEIEIEIRIQIQSIGFEFGGERGKLVLAFERSGPCLYYSLVSIYLTYVVKVKNKKGVTLGIVSLGVF